MRPDTIVEIVSDQPTTLAAWKPSPSDSFGFVLQFGQNSYSAARLSGDINDLLDGKPVLSNLAFLIRDVADPYLKISALFTFREAGLTGSGRVIEVFGREWTAFDELKTRVAYALFGTGIDLLFETNYQSFGSAQAVYGFYLPYGQQRELFRIIWDGRDRWATLQFQGEDGALKTTDPLLTFAQLQASRDPELLSNALDKILGVNSSRSARL